MLDQEKFFNTYKVQEAFEDSGLSWDTLERIYEDYTRRLPEMKKIADRLQDEISKVIDFHVHSIHNRCKDPEHLIEKIIRKVGVEKRQKYKNINERTIGAWQGLEQRRIYARKDFARNGKSILIEDPSAWKNLN